ncbi:MAG: serine hydrolase domain-containing protein [Parachlamydiaceae bacterium]
MTTNISTFPPESVSAGPFRIQHYAPSIFTDAARQAKIQVLFPEIEGMYQAYADKHHFPGYAYGVMVDGKLAHSGGGGFIDLDKKIPATPQSIFRIASMTKSFTAMAIIALRDEGLLTLDDLVSFYIPVMQNWKLTEDSPELTIRDLVIHSAGLPNDDPWADRELDRTDEELIALLTKGISFSRVTGIHYEYSNLGYTILGYIIKQVTGMSYGKYISEKICQPLGMDKVYWDFTNVPESQLAHGYKWIDGIWKEEQLLPDGIYGAMGGMLTSIQAFSQYAGWHQSAWPPRNDVETGPVKRSSVREAHQPCKLNLETTHSNDQSLNQTKGYGYGLRWMRDSQGKVFLGHGGGLPGFGSNWHIMPDYGIGVILFANVTYAPTYEVNKDVLEKLVAGAQLLPRQLPPSHLLQEKQKALVELLPAWENAEKKGLFASNFFLDYSIDALRKETNDLYAKAGKVLSMGNLFPENQLSGYFIMKCENADLRVSFSLTPENPPLVQQLQIRI